MAYTAWSVVFGEQPSAAKWNQLGANDAGFKDGSNIDAGVILSSHLEEGFVRGRQQSNTTDTAPTDMLTQWGWGYMAGTGAASASKAVTFPAAFSGLPYVQISGIGYRSGANPTNQGDTDGGAAGATSAHQTTVSGFTALYNQTGTFTSTIRIMYAWLAIGPE